MRLLLEIIATPLGINQSNSLRKILVLCLLSSCPGDGKLAEFTISDGFVAVQWDDVLVMYPSPAQGGKWIGEAALGLRTRCDTLQETSPGGPRVAAPQGKLLPILLFGLW